MKQGTVLIVDDDADTRRQLAWILHDDHHVLEAGDAGAARAAISRDPVDLVLLDLRLPPDPASVSIGMELLSWLGARHPAIPVIVMTGSRERETALRCVELGAFDFFEKPVASQELRVILGRALRLRALEREVASLRKAVRGEGALASIAGVSRGVVELRELVRRTADTPAAVLVRGETGTGKELVARALHEESRRREGPFVAVNCAAIPATLVEEELFGHERGAFTGAHERRSGKFEQADGGTLLLDEVGDLPMETQGKLLRVLQESAFQRLGGNTTVRVDVRVVAATHRDLESCVREQRFRQDLYYRLRVVEMAVPPLRERAEDIPLLAGFFVQRHGGGRVRSIARDAMDRLAAWTWPGNVRELEHAIQRGCVLSEGEAITVADLPPEIIGAGERRGVIAMEFPAQGLRLTEVECELVRRALERTGWNQTRAAALLGLTRAQIMQRMKRYRIEREDRE